jgi:microcystin-dependent protein
MALLHYKWSRTAASNATADAAINFQEGQAPSSVNDAARALMASAAGFRDDISGAIATGGTSTAYTVTSYQVFDSLANMSGHMLAFVPHTTSGATPTLNVDGLGAKALRQFPSVDLPAGVLIQGTPYVATYNNSDSAWYLQNSFVNPYQVPVGGMMDFIGTTAPNSAFVLPYGQAISRTTYSVLFAMVSTTFGVGDGSTTFNVPDLRGRVVAGKDDMGGSSANRLTDADDGLNGDTLGDTGGSETQTLVTANLPAYTPAGSVSTSVTVTAGVNTGGGASGTPPRTLAPINEGNQGNSSAAATATGSSTFTGTAQGGTSTAFGVIQPTIILNKILRVI